MLAAEDHLGRLGEDVAEGADVEMTFPGPAESDADSADAWKVRGSVRADLVLRIHHAKSLQRPQNGQFQRGFEHVMVHSGHGCHLLLGG